MKLWFPRSCSSISNRKSLSSLCLLSLIPVAAGGVDQSQPVQVSALRPGGVAEQWVLLHSLHLSSSLPLASFSQSLFISPITLFLSISLHLSHCPLSLNLSSSLPLPSFSQSLFISLIALFLSISLHLSHCPLSLNLFSSLSLPSFCQSLFIPCSSLPFSRLFSYFSVFFAPVHNIISDSWPS